MKVYSTTVFLGVATALQQEDPAGRCFKDRPDSSVPHDLPIWGVNGLPIYTEASNIEYCRQTCGQMGYFYAGVQAQSVCFCGNEYGTYGLADVSECNMLCKDLNNQGGRSITCGGSFRNEISRAHITYSHDEGHFKLSARGLINSMNLADLAFHGCWCSRLSGTSDLQGGDTIDAVDELCKEWFKKRRCLQLPGGACHEDSDNSYQIIASNSNLDVACSANPMRTCGGSACRIDEDMRRKLQAAVDELQRNGLEYPKVTTTCGAVNSGHANPSCVGNAPNVKFDFNTTATQP